MSASLITGFQNSFRGRGQIRLSVIGQEDPVYHDRDNTRELQTFSDEIGHPRTHYHEGYLRIRGVSLGSLMLASAWRRWSRPTNVQGKFSHLGALTLQDECNEQSREGSYHNWPHKDNKELTERINSNNNLRLARRLESSQSNRQSTTAHSLSAVRRDSSNNGFQSNGLKANHNIVANTKMITTSYQKNNVRLRQQSTSNENVSSSHKSSTQSINIKRQNKSQLSLKSSP